MADADADFDAPFKPPSRVPSGSGFEPVMKTSGSGDNVKWVPPGWAMDDEEDEIYCLPIRDKNAGPSLPQIPEGPEPDFYVRLIEEWEGEKELHLSLDMAFLVFGENALEVILDTRFKGDGMLGIERLEFYGR